MGATPSISSPSRARSASAAAGHRTTSPSTADLPDAADPRCCCCCCCCEGVNTDGSTSRHYLPIRQRRPELFSLVRSFARRPAVAHTESVAPVIALRTRPGQARPSQAGQGQTRPGRQDKGGGSGGRAVVTSCRPPERGAPRAAFVITSVQLRRRVDPPRRSIGGCPPAPVKSLYTQRRSPGARPSATKRRSVDARQTDSLAHASETRRQRLGVSRRRSVRVSRVNRINATITPSFVASAFASDEALLGT